tara:strand:+ start:177 stop:587 length:411 start_codon:yes stop_codon:yes gene_type:complete
MNTDEEYLAPAIEQVVENIIQLSSFLEKKEAAKEYLNGVTKMFGYEEDVIPAIISVYCEEPIYRLDDPRYKPKLPGVVGIPGEFSVEYFLFLIAQSETELDLFNFIKDYYSKKSSLLRYVIFIIIFAIAVTAFLNG